MTTTTTTPTPTAINRKSAQFQKAAFPRLTLTCGGLQEQMHSRRFPPHKKKKHFWNRGQYSSRSFGHVEMAPWSPARMFLEIVCLHIQIRHTYNLPIWNFQVCLVQGLYCTTSPVKVLGLPYQRITQHLTLSYTTNARDDKEKTFKSVACRTWSVQTLVY